MIYRAIGFFMKESVRIRKRSQRLFKRLLAV